jgi:nitrogen fixation/metabolism regulation signal transduction histidine kinase
VRRLALHDRLALISLLAGLPALVVALILLRRTLTEPLRFWLAAAALTVAWLAGTLLLRSRLVYRLRTAASLTTALRQGDLSVRARPARRDGAYNSLIAELNALSEALREQRLDDMEAVALLRNVLGEIDVAVFAFDDEQRLHMLNDAGERLLGKTAGAVMGREARELRLADCLKGEADRTLTLDLPGGSGRWALRRGSYRHLGRPRRLVVLSDVSRALRAEELAAWKRLIRVMSHELNNSLAPIRSLAGSMDRLIESQPPPEGWQDDLRTGLRVIASRAEALNRFVGAYASLAKLPEPRPVPVSMEPLVRRVAELESRLPVTVEAGPEVTVHADRDQLEQLLINLIKNAVDASLETGGGVRVGWDANGGQLVVKVIDEGPGVSETANLFVPFYSTRPEGTGIGLVLCRQIAEAHGGSVALSNRDDADGCEASVILPLRSSLEA